MLTTLTDLIEQIDDLIARSGPTASKHDKALAAITACIANGVDTKDGIIRVLVSRGFDGGHVANVLHDRKGPFRNSDHWVLGADGRYRLA